MYICVCIYLYMYINVDVYICICVYIYGSPAPRHPPLEVALPSPSLVLVFSLAAIDFYSYVGLEVWNVFDW